MKCFDRSEIWSPCFWNMLARPGKSCHPSDNICSRDNCFQRSWCPPTLFLSSLPHTYAYVISLSLPGLVSLNHFSWDTLFFSPNLHLFCSQPLCHRLCHLYFKVFLHLHIILWSHFLSLRHLNTHFHLPFLPTLFISLPHFQTADFDTYLRLFFFIPLIQSPQSPEAREENDLLELYVIHSFHTELVGEMHNCDS